jgi:hypothetical protein
MKTEVTSKDGISADKEVLNLPEAGLQPGDFAGRLHAAREL